MVSGNLQTAELAEGVLEGDRRAVAQAISLYENGGESEAAHDLMAAIWPHTGQALTLGITGPPGAGKSTLTSGLIEHLRQEEDRTVGVIAVDPSSSVSQGALLGDRIRMTDHQLDPGVFIRSMSARGHLGGVAEATFPAAAVLDAAGKDVVIVETVGVGQSETEVRSLTDAVIVVLQPGAGDGVQNLKSGLLEVPDIICLNKSDRSDAALTRNDLAGVFPQSEEDSPRLVETSALYSMGIDELWMAVQAHFDRLGADGLKSRREANLAHFVSSVAIARMIPAFSEVLSDTAGQESLSRLADRNIDPFQVVNSVIDRWRAQDRR